MIGASVLFVGTGASSAGDDSAVAPIPAERAIRVALAKLGNHSWFAPFPRRIGRIDCQIPGGGLIGGSFPGYCQTRVSVGRTYVTVAFTEVWDSDAFDGSGGRSDGALTHTWVVIESKRLRALDVTTFGDFPPQWVR